MARFSALMANIVAILFQPDTTTAPGPSGIANAYLQYNEYIAYDVAQIWLRYLLRVEMKN